MANTTIIIGGYYTPSVASSNTFTVLLGDIPLGNIQLTNNGSLPVFGGFNLPTVSSVITSNTAINQVVEGSSFTVTSGILPSFGGFSVPSVSSVTRMSTFIQTAPDPFGAPAAPSSQYWYMS